MENYRSRGVLYIDLPVFRPLYFREYSISLWSSLLDRIEKIEKQNKELIEKLKKD